LSTERVDISASTVKAALKMAQDRAPGVNIWADNRDHYLLIRQRGGAADWLVKTRGRTRVLGALRERDPDFLSVTAARARAVDAYNEIRKGPAAAAPVEPQAAWRWSDLDREYQASLTELRWSAGRVKPPSRGTQDDVRLAFAKHSVTALGPKLLTEITSLELTRAVGKVHAENGHRAACKTLAYIKSAMSWALTKRGEKSGLHGTMPWWTALRPPDPTGTEIVQMQERKRSLVAAKIAFSVDHLGELLTAHEAFCAGRRANEKIGPGVRWGLWWVAFTGNRRFSTVGLERDRLFQTDEFGRDGAARYGRPT
jgi:hypothetical protein